MGYFGNIRKGIVSTWKGLRLTWRHLWDARYTRGPMNVEQPTYFDLEKGHVTLQYPHEQITIPDHGRYQLDCEIDDCIVCDKCAKICPVDCIEIEAIKSPEVISYTSDGSPVRLYAAKFDIDMAKCCFCGLCTTVCPTECLTMNNEFDYSTFDVIDLAFAFAKLSPEEATEKRELYEQFMAEKAALKATAAPVEVETPQPAAKPAFRPTMKPPTAAPTEVETPPPATKPAFRPTMKPPTAAPAEAETPPPAAKPAFRPTMKPPTAAPVEDETPQPAAKPAFRPTMKPPTAAPVETETPQPAAKPAFRPTMKPKPLADTPPDKES